MCAQGWLRKRSSGETLNVIMLFLLLGTTGSKIKTSRCTAPTLIPFDGDLTRITLVCGPSFPLVSSAGSWFLSTSSQSSGLWMTQLNTHIFYGDQKTTEVGTVVRSTFSQFICYSQMESTYSEVQEARRFSLGLQCPQSIMCTLLQES